MTGGQPGSSLCFANPGGGTPLRVDPDDPRSARSRPGRPLPRVGDDAADDLAVVQVLVARVDVVERVAAGDELVELELAGPVEAEQPGDVVERVAHAEDVTLDAALPADHAAVGGQLYLLLGAAADGGDGHLAALAHDRRRLVHHLGVEHADGDERVV